MNPDNLELFSTGELIDELLRRSTFQGVIVHSREEIKNRTWWGERIFSVRHNANLNVEETARLLGCVSQYIEAEG